MYDSIQQSPIDPVFAENTSDEDEEVARVVVPTPIKDKRLRLLISEDWIYQLTKPLNEGNVIVMNVDNEKLCVEKNHIKIYITLNGLNIFREASWYSLLDENIPIEILDIYNSGFIIVENWRARVVTLTMETDDIECSLMDDLYPPKSILAEYKSNVVLRSMKVQKGMVFITTIVRTIALPLSMMEGGQSVKKTLATVTPELMVVDMDKIWTNFVEIRKLCLDEYKRINDKTIGMHGG